MNYKSVAIAAVVAWIVDSIYGYLVFGVMLEGQFSAYPAVFRSMDAITPNLPLLFAGTLLGMLVLAYIYAKGYEGGSGVQEGMRFGILIAIFAVGFISIGNYVTLNIGRRVAAVTAVAGAIEMIIDGTVIGALYKPAARS